MHYSGFTSKRRLALMPSLYNKVILSSVGVIALSNFANASLTIDFRFPAGANSPDPHSYIVPNPGDLTPISFDAWAIVTGAAGNANEEGLQSAMFAARSAVASTGITGGISSFTRATGWTYPGSQAGAATNLSSDGIGDWGNATNATISLSPSYLRVRTTKSVNNPIDWGDADSPAGSVYHDLPGGSVEFFVGTFVFTPTSVAQGGVLIYAPVTLQGGTPTPAGWWEDTPDKTSSGPSFVKSPTNPGGTYLPLAPNSSNLNAVTIFVPEPTSLSLLGLNAMAVMRRRRLP